MYIVTNLCQMYYFFFRANYDEQICSESIIIELKFFFSQLVYSTYLTLVIL